MTSELDIYKKAEVAIQNAHGIYLDHESRLEKARGAISGMLAKAEKGMNEDLYNNIGSLLKKLDATAKKFNEDRSPVTKAAQAIVKAFTSQENELDYKKEGTDAYKLKYFMDRFAADQAKKEAERREQERIRIEKERELNSVKASAVSFLERVCTKAVQEMKENISNQIDSVTLSNYDEVKKSLTGFDVRVPEGLFQQLDLDIKLYYASKDDKENVLNQFRNSVDWKEFKEPYENEVSVYLHESISKLPTIRKELEEIASADKKEQERMMKEKQRREDEEREQREADNKAAAKAAAEKEEQRIKQAEIQSKFEFGASVGSSNPVKAKHGYLIDLVMPAGLMDLVRFWASEQEWPMDDAAVMRVTFDRMKKFAEKEASKDKFIESEFVSYKEDIKSKL